MSCCGNRRQQLRMSTREREPSQPRRYSTAFFQYVGRTALTALGTGTAQQYRFHRPGAIVAVDPRDAASLARIPQLRQVHHP